MPYYTVTEPHPTVSKGSYTRSGRGGAGNFFRAPATTPPSGVPSVVQPMPPSNDRFYTGRGGAGNARAGTARPTLSFDEQYKIQSQAEERASGHVGRGGAGNVYGTSTTTSSKRKSSDASSLRSGSSIGSVKSGFMQRLTSVSSKGPM